MLLEQVRNGPGRAINCGEPFTPRLKELRSFNRHGQQQRKGHGGLGGGGGIAATPTSGGGALTRSSTGGGKCASPALPEVGSRRSSGGTPKEYRGTREGRESASFDVEDVELRVESRRDTVRTPYGSLPQTPNNSGKLVRDHKVFSNGNAYRGTWFEGRMQGDGLYTWSDGAEYAGEFREGFMWGEGEKRWPTGRKYMGEWVRDMMWGDGKMTWPSGERFVGQFRKGIFHGRGARNWPNGDWYEGQFVNGEQEGNGTFGSADDGWTYTGRWLHGRMNGEGRVVLPDGVCYAGEWQDGTRAGVGRLSWPDGSWYEGQFRDNRIEGRGRKVLPDGSWFEGHFHDGELTGTGTFHWADGNEFEGLWHNSEIVGPGCHRLPDETTIIGVFEDRGASGEGTKKWASGCTYTGRLLRNHIHQHGVLKWPDGRTYVGGFHGETMHGEGTLTWSDRDGLCRYKGRFENNAFHGPGILEWSNKARYVGQFQDGQYHGNGTFEWPDRMNVYRGEWAFGEMCGRGMLAAAGSELCQGNGGDAFVYVGEFDEGDMQGDGHVTFLGSGNRPGPRDEYRGAFACSLFHGLGTFTWASGHSISGCFQEHRCNSVGCKVYPGGLVYYGELEDDVEHGKGMLTDGKARLIGLWKKGRIEQELFETSVHALDLDAMPGEESQRVFAGLREAQGSDQQAPPLPLQDETGKAAEGQAILLYLNGDKYFGLMKGGKKHGLGMYVYADLTAYKGQWESDAFGGVGGVKHPDKDRSEQAQKLHNLNEDKEVQVNGLKKFAETQGQGTGRPQVKGEKSRKAGGSAAEGGERGGEGS
eukprot:TRINITY_DN5694_c0_g1_i1.p1 TRINITY_DN5694_c0_g1~~TRINITY_DN5694_c0_g1_i1.p1  ORF type:complete len:812 (+),score=178.31 TRINITY_DN5694_c0_g1_i1:156-2591(+)